MTIASLQERERLGQLRLALLRIHKALLDAERLRYERTHGRVANGFALFHLVSSDPFFAWLQPLTALIVRMDEKLDTGDELSHEDVLELRAEATSLMAPQRDGDGFTREYDRVIQDVPDVLIQHTRLERLL
jgi:hypothetical protein